MIWLLHNTWFCCAFDFYIIGTGVLILRCYTFFFPIVIPGLPLRSFQWWKLILVWLSCHDIGILDVMLWYLQCDVSWRMKSAYVCSDIIIKCHNMSSSRCHAMISLQCLFNFSYIVIKFIQLIVDCSAFYWDQ